MSPVFFSLFFGCNGSSDTSEFEVPGTDIVLLGLESGSFEMGSPEDEIGRGTDEDLHEVHLTTEVWMAQTEFRGAGGIVQYLAGVYESKFPPPES